MTNQDLYDWVIANGCEIMPLQEHMAKVIRLRNPNTGREAFLYLPIDTRHAKEFLVCKVCSNLGIPLPDFVTPTTRTLNTRLDN